MVMTARTGLVLAVALAIGCSDEDARGMPWTSATAASTVADADASTSDIATSDAESSDASTRGSDGTHGDTSTASDAESTGAIDCTVPPPNPAWLDDHLREVIGTLSGELEIQAGVTLPDRATSSRRAQVAAWLIGNFAANGIIAEAHDYGSGTNVVARIPATGASAGTWVVGAHYDSVPESPGADDNASGTAIVTALGRWLVDVPCRNADVIVVAFDEEELGLVGSTAFAAKLVTENEPVLGVHTVDQIGWDADGDRSIEIERPDEGLFEFYADVAADVPALGSLTITDTGFTDHVAFREAGFKATGLSEEYVSGDTTPYYHSPGDGYDTVDFGFVATAATLVNRAFGRAVGEP
jgi:peptidase M28-like protein